MRLPTQKFPHINMGSLVDNTEPHQERPTKLPNYQKIKHTPSSPCPAKLNIPAIPKYKGISFLESQIHLTLTKFRAKNVIDLIFETE